MKLSLLTYTLSRKISFPVETPFELCQEAEIEGINWLGTYGNDPKLINKISSDTGIPTVCYTFTESALPFPDRLQEASENIKRHIENAVIMQAPQMMLCTPGTDRDRLEYRKMWAEGIGNIHSLFEDANITLTIEHFPGPRTPMATSEDFHFFKSVVPGLKLTFDSGNAYCGGEDPVESYEKCVSDIVHVHFKDYARSEHEKPGYQKMLSGAYYESALTGEGGIDFISLARCMLDNEYDGYIDLEYEGDKYPPIEAVKRMATYIRELFDTA